MEYYPRKIEEKLDQWLNRRETIIVKGPRQSGKTTLLLHLNEKFGGNYVTLEDEDMLRALEENPKAFARRFLQEEKTLLFLDEAQYSKKAGRLIKLIFDTYSDRLKLVVTGSGSFDIKVEVGKHLVGRAVYFELFPLDFEEFLMWKARDLHKTFLDYREAVKRFISKGEEIEFKPVFEREFKSLLSEYLVFGGFPAIVKEKDEKVKKELLQNLARTYLEKDVFFFLNVRHIEKFRSLLKYLSFNTGLLFEPSSVMRELRMDYRTVETYLSILSNTYIIFLLPPFYKNLTTELKKSKKVYFNDLGLRNSILDNFLPPESRTDRGILLENFVFNELKSTFEGKINYWRTTGKAEVDFVVSLRQKFFPAEVKSHEKLRRGFLSFLNAYRPKRALVFTEGEFGVKEVNQTKIAFIPHYFI
ncbi:MAG: ATP-binding protein [Thermoproteota archaeon]